MRFKLIFVAQLSYMEMISLLKADSLFSHCLVRRREDFMSICPPPPPFIAYTTKLSLLARFYIFEHTRQLCFPQWNNHLKHDCICVVIFLQQTLNTFVVCIIPTPVLFLLTNPKVPTQELYTYFLKRLFLNLDFTKKL